VTILFDWQLVNGGPIIGCPDNAGQPQIGRNFIQLVANDGTSLFVTVPWSFDLATFVVDMAQPDNSHPSPDISCSPADSGIRVGSYDGTTFCGNVLLPHLHTECDTGTWGATGGGGVFPILCDPGSIPPVARGKLYSKTATCGTSPDTTLSTWSALAVTPDANTGAFCVPIPRPPSPDPINNPQCAFVAASGMVGGKETLAAVGAAQLAGQNAPSARAVDVSAKAGGNSVSISFRTVGELGLVGFNVLTDAQGGRNRIKANSALITPNGVEGGGASYAIQIPRANFKGGKVLYIESVLKSGTLLSDPATF